MATPLPMHLPRRSLPLLVVVAGALLPASLVVAPSPLRQDPKPAPAAPAAGDAADPLAAVAFLAGQWRRETPRMVHEEHWMPPRGGTLIGMARIAAGERTLLHEYLRIERTKDGGVDYVAQPFGRPPTRFALVESGGDKVAFANPKHDFPQRIEYWLDAKGDLHARVSGEQGGKQKSEDYSWQRADAAK